jgi:bifunctional DNA-binding transcriptional regulator/antitoxin component of YhaV-PrlF toxin-antitoxin module
MKPAISKITAKGQTTVPQEVRVALKSKPGDLLAWEVGKEGRVAVRRVQPMDVEYLRAVEKTMSEWNTAEDDSVWRSIAVTMSFAFRFLSPMAPRKKTHPH